MYREAYSIPPGGVGLGMLNCMLGPTLPSDAQPGKAWVGLVPHLIVPLRAIHYGTLPQSRLAQPGVVYFILFYHRVGHGASGVAMEMSHPGTQWAI